MNEKENSVGDGWKCVPTDMFTEFGQWLPQHCLPALKAACKYANSYAFFTLCDGIIDAIGCDWQELLLLRRATRGAGPPHASSVGNAMGGNHPLVKLVVFKRRVAQMGKGRWS